MSLKSLVPNRPALEFIDFFTSLRAAPVPQSVLDNAKWCLLDALGCGLFGSQQPCSFIVADEVYSEKSQGCSTVFGHKKTIAAAPAALFNGTAIHGFELDDVIGDAVVHPGATVVPAALATAEAVDASGLDLLLGIIAGYEAMRRLSLAIGLEPSHRGFHKTSVVGPIAAAIAAGVVMNQTIEKMTHAIALACSAASGIKAFAAGGGSGGMGKRMHAGRSAEGGVRMSQLAQRGFTGADSSIDGRFGLLEVFGGQTADARQLTQGLGELWAVNNVWVKVYPMCGWIQGVVQLISSMRKTQGIHATQVKAVTVGTSEFAVKNNASKIPSDTMGAQYSIPYCVALALTADPGDPAEFALDAIGDSRKLAIADRVEVCVDPETDAVFPRQFGCRVEVLLEGGRRLDASLRDAHGTAADPCTEDERIGKFCRLAAFSPLPGDAKDIVVATRNLDRMTSIREFSDLLRR